MFEKLTKSLETQGKFSDLFFDSENLSDKEKEELTKTFLLALNAELSEIADSINFKDHHTKTKEINKAGILFNCVDVFRYTLAVLNLWEFTDDQFHEACVAKDMFLNMRHKIDANKWEGQPVVIVDIDDVLAEFRRSFFAWLSKNKGVHTPFSCPEYYNVTDVLAAGLAPEQIFREFIDDSGFMFLEENLEMVNEINKLYESGYWIQLLTARPADNLKCMYDTYAWASNSLLKFHELAFSGEKFRWLSDREYYEKGKVVCAIDDSPKHSLEYAKHGVPVFSPKLPYNVELEGKDLITMYDSPVGLSNKVKELANK